MIARRLTMIAHIERNGVTGKDAWNVPLAPNFQPHAEVPCFAYSKASGDVVDGKKLAITHDLRMMFALGIDVRADDRVAKITDRKGATLIPGPLRIDGAVEYKHNHMEAALVRVA